jgi:plastocyanin
MGNRRSVGVAVVGALAGLLILIGSVGAASTARVKIGETSGKYHFSPTTAFVNVGGTVTWTNGSDAPHTVTSDSGSELASATLNAGKTFSHTFAATGTFSYHCTIHTYMVGKVVVLAAGVTAPPTDTAMTAATASPEPNVGLPVALFLVGLSGGVLALRRFRGQRKPTNG